MLSAISVSDIFSSVAIRAWESAFVLARKGSLKVVVGAAGCGFPCFAGDSGAGAAAGCKGGTGVAPGVPGPGGRDVPRITLCPRFVESGAARFAESCAARFG